MKKKVLIKSKLAVALNIILLNNFDVIFKVDNTLLKSSGYIIIVV